MIDAQRKAARCMEFAVTDISIHLSNVALNYPRIPALLGRSLSRFILARSIRLALYELPDAVLHDIGITRGEIPFVACELARGREARLVLQLRCST